MKSDNYYYRKIYEYLTSTTVTEKHTDKYYLKGIANAMGYEYEWTRSKVKYLRDVAVSISYQNLLRKNNAIYYLRYIASVLSEDTIEENNHQNYYLKIIYTNRENMTSNNEYYRLICEILNNADYETGETDVYYLTEILASYDVTYASAQCKGKLLKDWASAVTGETYTGSHTNIYYLKEIEDELSGETVIETENNLLKEIYTAIEDDATSSTTTLSASKSSVELTETYSLSGTLSVGSGESVKIYLKGTESDTLIDTVTTGSGGAFSKTGLSQSTTGEYVYYAKYDGDETYRGSTSSDVTVTVTKKQPVITFTTSDSSVTYGDTVTLTGTLQHNSTGMNNASVIIYKDDTYLDTVTTSSGSFSKTISDLGVDTYTFKAVYEGDSTYASATSSNVSVEVNQQGATLNITVPLTLIYSDEFNITGELTDGTDPIVGATVTLLVGSSPVTTGTTNSNGEVSFTRTPVHMGTHTFKLSYAGDTDHTGGVSSTVTRDITKETSVLTVTSPSNTVTNMYNDGTLTITGTLLTDDGEKMSGESVTVVESGTTIKTMTTDSNGAFSDTITGLSTGEHTYTIGFATTSTHTASSVTKTVVVTSPSIALASDKDILSYADSESATLTATVSATTTTGKTVQLYEMVGSSQDPTSDTLVGTMTDENDGTYTYTCSSTGAGDRKFYAKCGSILSERYEVSDILKHDSCASDNTSNYDTTYSTNQTFAYDSLNSAYKVTRTATGFGAILVPNLNVPKNVEISVDAKVYHPSSSNNNTQIRVGLWNESGKGIGAMIGYFPQANQRYFRVHNILYTADDSSPELIVDDGLNTQLNTWYRLVLQLENGTITFKAYDMDDTLLKTCTGTTSKFTTDNNIVGLQTLHMAGAELYFKNFKVKAL